MSRFCEVNSWTKVFFNSFTLVYAKAANLDSLTAEDRAWYKQLADYNDHISAPGHSFPVPSSETAWKMAFITAKKMQERIAALQGKMAMLEVLRQELGTKDRLVDSAAIVSLLDKVIDNHSQGNL